MKFYVITLTLTIASITNVFGMDYINEEYGIHFVLPGNWKVIDFIDLPLEKQKKLNRITRPFNTLSISSYKEENGQDSSQIIIQYRKFENSTFEKAKRFIQTEHGKELLITSAKGHVEESQKIKLYKVVETESDFVNSANRGYAIVHYESNGRPDLIGMVVKILVKDGVVNLRCFARGSETGEFVDTVNNIADSFQYNGYGFSQGTVFSDDDEAYSDEQTAKQIWKWGGILLTVSIILGFIKMLFFRD